MTEQKVVTEVEKKDFQNRVENAMKEINPILENYQVTIGANLEYSPEGILPKVTIIDVKKIEEKGTVEKAIEGK